MLQAHKPVRTGAGSRLPPQPLAEAELSQPLSPGLICVLLSKMFSTCHRFQTGLRRSPGGWYLLSHVPHPFSQAQAGAVHRPELLTPTQLHTLPDCTTLDLPKAPAAHTAISHHCLHAGAISASPVLEVPRSKEQEPGPALTPTLVSEHEIWPPTLPCP